MKKLTTFTVVLLCSLVSYSVSAWNDMGHTTIASLAEQHLTPKTKEMCRKYLNHTLPYYAAWMDQWRNCPGYEHTSSWHTYPVDERNKRFKGESRDAAYQAMRISKQMRKYEKLSDSIVRDNLKYLIHLIADIHCPVHIKYANEPNLKQGSLRMKGKKYKFHAFWDSTIDYYHKGMKCDAIAKQYDTFTDKQIVEICKGNIANWAKVNAEQMREIYTLLPMNSEVTAVSEENHQRMKEITIQQMRRGGYRLAKVLNGIFDK